MADQITPFGEQAFIDIDDVELDPEGRRILDRLAELDRERGRIEAEMSERMVAYSDHVRQRAQRHEDPRIHDLEVLAAADQISLMVHQPTRVVSDRIARTRRLHARLTWTWEAHQAGALDDARVRLLAETVAKIERTDTAIELDVRGSRYAATHTVRQLRSWLNRFLATREPDQHEKRRRAEAENRSAWVEHGPDGWSWLHALIPTAAAHRVDRLLNRLGEQRSDGNDDLNVEQARSDVLVDLLLGAVDHQGSATDRTHGGASIAITVPITSLAGLDDAPGIAWDGSFARTAQVVRELAREPGTLFHRVLTDPAGHVLDVTELGRFPSRRLRTAVTIRDGTCSFATCDRPAESSDLDHVVPHPRGPTSGSNLRPLCRHHHVLKTACVLPDPL